MAIDWVKEKAKQAKIKEDLDRYDKAQRERNLQRTIDLARKQGKKDVEAVASKKLSDSKAPTGSKGTLSVNGKEYASTVYEMGGKKVVVGIGTPDKPPQTQQPTVVTINQYSQPKKYIKDSSGKVIGYEDPNTQQSVLGTATPTPVQQTYTARPNTPSEFTGGTGVVSLANARERKANNVVEVFSQSFADAFTMNADAQPLGQLSANRQTSTPQQTAREVGATAGYVANVFTFNQAGNIYAGGKAVAQTVSQISNPFLKWGAGLVGGKLAGDIALQGTEEVLLRTTTTAEERQIIREDKNLFLVGERASERALGDLSQLNAEIDQFTKARNDASSKFYLDAYNAGVSAEEAQKQFNAKFPDVFKTTVVKYYTDKGLSPQTAEDYANRVITGQKTTGLESYNIPVINWNLRSVANELTLFAGDKPSYQRAIGKELSNMGYSQSEIDKRVGALTTYRNIKGTSEIAGLVAIETTGELTGQGLFSSFTKGTSSSQYYSQNFAQRFLTTAKATAPAGAIEGALGTELQQENRGRQKDYKDVVRNAIFGSITAGTLGGLAGAVKKPVQQTAVKFFGYAIDPYEPVGDFIAGRIDKGLRVKTPTSSIVPVPSETERNAFTQQPSFTFNFVPSITNTPVNIPPSTIVPTDNPPSPKKPSGIFSFTPTNVPTNIPTQIPNNVPNNVPNNNVPNFVPTDVPVDIPTDIPVDIPTNIPTNVPTDVITSVPVLTPVWRIPPPLPIPSSFDLGGGGFGYGRKEKTFYVNELAISNDFLRSALGINNIRPAPAKKYTAKKNKTTPAKKKHSKEEDKFKKHINNVLGFKL